MPFTEQVLMFKQFMLVNHLKSTLLSYLSHAEKIHRRKPGAAAYNLNKMHFSIGLHLTSVDAIESYTI